MEWNLAANGISASHMSGQNHVDRSAVMFCRDEFRTPSPQLPAWHRPEWHRPEPFDSSAIMDEDSNDDFYFHSSENIDSNLQQVDVKSMNYRSDSGLLNSSNQFVALEAMDSQNVQCVTLELPDSGDFGSRLTRTNRTVDERISQLSKNHGLIIDGRSKWTLHLCVYVYTFIVIFNGASHSTTTIP